MIDASVVHILEGHDVVALMVKGLAGRKALDGVRGVEDKLADVAAAEDQPILVRFKAFEALFARAPKRLGRLDAAGKAVLARVYAGAARALRETNLFGLPPDVGASETSRRLMSAGPAAVAALAPLLQDRAVARYADSEEATIAAMKKYRYRDLAAALIGSILGVPWDDATDPAERARSIDTLEKRIKTVEAP